ncbi:MAG: divalent-cation tolerance protein CutA [Candidatus Omnitrophota bacterium]|nr:divalent-cation tolerance protein CutA [Candidatus Omnitrophota bacterium]
MNNSFISITVSCASRQEARKIVNRLLAKKLVACANIVSGIESKFWWKAKIDSAKEVLIVMKTRRSNFKKIETEVKKMHSYEVPEIIAIPIIAGSKDYLDWISRTVV